MKILITGATGFVATNLLPMLTYDHEVYGLDNFSQSKFIDSLHKQYKKFFKADILDRKLLNNIISEVKPDVIFHFAGLVSIYDCNNNISAAINNNIVGSTNVFELALSNGCTRVIFSETSAVYENCQLPTHGFIESQSDPTTIYATTKAAVALIAESLSRNSGLKYTALRYFNIAGPLQDIHRTVPPLFAGVALRLLAGNNPIIFGDGNRRRDFIHIDDINNFHMLCLTNKETINQTYNLGSGISYSLFDICKYIRISLLLKDSNKYDLLPEINGEAFEIKANIKKAESLGWFPIKSIEDAIDDTIIYLKNEIYSGKIKPEKYMQDLKIEDIKI